ncbi:hypothetical protein [Sinorhizobium meliloti]|uniref:hypothetical protein n=1 Tax=Rhizobium meliloti TaxID=382 RepID=UPI003D660740
MTELSLRLDKLRFLTEELQLAFTLSQAAPDAWNARLVARHILVRAHDFIEHARQARRLIRLHGSDQEFHAAKETYASWFEEYFKTARHKLGAHVQDLDFGLRIDLWNGIETSKIGTFVEGAAELYNGLAKLNLPGYVPLPSALPEMADAAFLSALSHFQQSAPSPRAEFASDPLAMTRPATISGSGKTPVHERASQLSLIARWIAWDQATLERFAAFPRVRRILLSRLLTDVVSFADCLVTRPVAAGALQAMAGFNDLMAADADEPSPALTAFLAGYQFLPAVGPFRAIRDQIGGHLEIDGTQHLHGIISRLDAVDLSELQSFFQIMRNAFHAACAERVYLTLYRADGERVRGGVPKPNNALVAYDPTAPAASHPNLVRVHEWSENGLRQAIADWLSSNAEKQEAALDAFRTGFAMDRGGEEFTVEHSSGSSKRWDRHSFSLAHRVLLQELLDAPSPEHFGLLIDLLLQAGRGYPTRSAETLIRYIEANGPLLTSPALIHALGMVAEWDVPRYATPLADATKPNQPWPCRREAILGLYRAFIRDEGLRRVNQREAFSKLTDEIEPLITALSLAEELEVRLSMASIVWDFDLSFLASKFENELQCVNGRLLTIVSEELSATGRAEDIETARKLAESGYYIGVVFLLASPSKGADYRPLLECVRDGTIVPGRDERSALHLISCLWFADEKRGALSVATRLAQRFPGNVSHELLRLELLSNIPGHRDEVLAGAARLRRDFQLSPDDMTRLSGLEVDLGPS